MAIEVGTKAPDFELKNQHGELVKLSDFRGEKAVVLLFYPFAFTGVCTGELQAIQEQLPAMQNDAVQVLAVSCDSMFSLRVFAEREGLEFPMLADYWPHGAVARAYGVFDAEVGCALRGTFVIDRSGVIRWSVANAIPDARDVGEYRTVLESLAA